MDAVNHPPPPLPPPLGSQVTLEDLERVMQRRRLPRSHARSLLRRVRRHWLASSFGWAEFHALMEAREPAMLRAFTSLCLAASGTLKKSQVRGGEREG